MIGRRNGIDRLLFLEEHEIGAGGDRAAHQLSAGASRLISLAADGLRTEPCTLYVYPTTSDGVTYVYLGIKKRVPALKGLFSREVRSVPLAAIEHNSGRLEVRVYEPEYERLGLQVAYEGNRVLERHVSQTCSYGFR